MHWDVVIIGAGCSGLSAATRLAELGHKVLVLERRPVLGGRASSFRDPCSGEVLDNGQHVLLGCYEETRKFLSRIGSDSNVEWTRRLEVRLLGPDGSQAIFGTGGLPAPFHLMWAILGYQGLTFKEKVRFFTVAKDLVMKHSSALSNVSVAQWLRKLGQTDNVCKRFFHPLTLATLNANPEMVPAEWLAVVLKKGFLASSRSSILGIPHMGLSDLFGESSKQFLRQRGGDVWANSCVRKIVFHKHHAVGVELYDGSVEEAHVVISAVPPPMARELVSQSPLKHHVASSCNLVASPIVSVHAWVTEVPFVGAFVGLWGSRFHWVFRKESRERTAPAPYLTFVASAATQMLSKKKQDLVKLAREELENACRATIEIRRAVVTKEYKATWIPRIDSADARCAGRTKIANCFFVGDWTDTGLPPTIEGAVVSGHRVAQDVEDFLIQPSSD